MEKKKVVIPVIICICVSALLSFLIVNGIQIAMCDSLYYKLKTLEYENIDFVMFLPIIHLMKNR